MTLMKAFCLISSARKLIRANDEVLQSGFCRLCKLVDIHLYFTACQREIDHEFFKA